MKSIVLILLLFVVLTGFDPQPVTTDVCVTPEEMKLYTLIMEYRKTKKLEAIPLSTKLTLVAQTHAKDLADHYKFDPKNKCNPHSWSGKGNWSACCYADHNQASCMWIKPREIADYPGNGYEIAYYSSIGASAQEGLDGWKISRGHNPLLINSGTWSTRKWKAIGIGIYKEYGLVWFGEEEDKGVVDLCQ